MTEDHARLSTSGAAKLAIFFAVRRVDTEFVQQNPVL
jgi:hypothetical protein